MDRRSFIGSVAVLTGSGATLGIPGAVSATDSTVQDPETTQQAKPLIRIQVTAPSTIGVGEPFWIGIRMLTTPFYARWVPVWQRKGLGMNGPFNVSSRGIQFMDNVVPEWGSEVQLAGDEGFEGPASLSFGDGTEASGKPSRGVMRREGFKFTTPGVKYIRITDPVTGITGVSNPIQVSEEAPGERLYWGNLHSHSIFSDGIRLPEELHAFARDESFLDVYALTDHTEALTNGQWGYVKSVANEYDEPGRFVAFLGGEWTHPEYGHRNFIYPGDDGPVLRCTDSDQDEPAKLNAAAKRAGGLIIVNHPAGYSGIWQQDADAEVVRLTEIYSIGGVQETPYEPATAFPSRHISTRTVVSGTYAEDALNEGLRIGFIGASDDHDGRPGDAIHELQEEPGDYKSLRSPGLLGVWAKGLTRNDVFDALWNRRVFGTTNHRTMLKFSINGSPMGSAIHAGGPLKISIDVASNIAVRRIVLISKGTVVRSVETDQLHGTWAFEEQEPADGTWYYVRIELAKEHLAWSSPIWVDRA